MPFIQAAASSMKLVAHFMQFRKERRLLSFRKEGGFCVCSGALGGAVFFAKQVVVEIAARMPLPTQSRDNQGPRSDESVAIYTEGRSQSSMKCNRFGQSLARADRINSLFHQSRRLEPPAQILILDSRRSGGRSVFRSAAVLSLLVVILKTTTTKENFQ